MKRVLLSMAAAACALCTFAQDANVVLPDSVWITPYAEEGVILDSVDDTVTIHMDKVPSVPVTIMFVTGNGFGIDMKYIRKTVDTSSFDLKLSRENWGVPFNEEFFMNLGVTFTYGEGDDIEYYLNDEGEPILGEAMFMTHDYGPAEFVRSYPTGEWEKYFTFADAYEEGTATLYFTKNVEVNGILGSIIYYDEDGNPLDLVPTEINQFESLWSEWDGLYTLSFSFKSDEYDAEDISRLVIEFGDITIPNSSEKISVPKMVLENIATGSPKSTPRKSAARISEKLAVEESVNVFNLQGIPVANVATINDLNTLPAGMYIVNGKKILVK